jgi:hypothetical protein
MTNFFTPEIVEALKEVHQFYTVYQSVNNHETRISHEAVRILANTNAVFNIVTVRGEPLEGTVTFQMDNMAYEYFVKAEVSFVFPATYLYGYNFNTPVTVTEVQLFIENTV